MGWQDITFDPRCDNCGSSLALRPKKLWSPGTAVRCPKCHASVALPAPPLPNVPSCLYIGPEKVGRIKIQPLPPKDVVYKNHGEYHQWAGGGCNSCEFNRGLTVNHGSAIDCGFAVPGEVQPYSIRSILAQVSMRSDFPCKYFIQDVHTDGYGNTTWHDGCMASCGGSDYSPYYHECNLANGWMYGEKECPGWAFIAGLCQTDIERLFLRQYLRFNHDREFPMPIPQVYVEVEERIRVDFAVFVPVTRFEWRWLAIEVDSGEYHQDRQHDSEREAVLTGLGFEVTRLSSKAKMLDQVRALYRRVTELQSPDPAASRRCP